MRLPLLLLSSLSLFVIGCASSIHRDSGFNSGRVANSTVILALPMNLSVVESELFDQNWALTHGMTADSAEEFFHDLFLISFEDLMKDGMLRHDLRLGAEDGRFEEVVLKTVEGTRDTLVRRGTWNSGTNSWDSIWVSTTTANHVTYTYLRPADDLIADAGHKPDISITLSNVEFADAIYRDGPLSSRIFTRAHREASNWDKLDDFCAWVELPVTAQYMIWDHKRDVVLMAGNAEARGTSVRVCDITREHWISAVEGITRSVLRGTPLLDNRVTMQDYADQRAPQAARRASPFTEYLRDLQLRKQAHDQQR